MSDDKVISIKVGESREWTFTPPTKEEIEAHREKLKRDHPEFFKSLEEMRKRNEEYEEWRQGCISELVDKAKESIKKRYALLFAVTDHNGNELPRGSYFECSQYFEGPYPFFFLGHTEIYRWKEMPSDSELSKTLRYDKLYRIKRL